MVISAGEDYRFGHSDPEVLEQASEVGAIEVISDEEGGWWEAQLRDLSLQDRYNIGQGDNPMPNESRHNRASTVMGKINRAWLDGRVDEMAPMIHPEIVMVLPAFSGQIQGRDAFLDGFHDFVQNATIHEFREIDQQVNVVGDTAVIHFKYKMVYEMAGRRFRATGRDLWVFQEHEETWLAVWRAMLNTDEQEV